MEDESWRRCIACDTAIGVQRVATLRVETPYGAVTCYYHDGCFRAGSPEEQAGDVYRLAGVLPLLLPRLNAVQVQGLIATAQRLGIPIPPGLTLPGTLPRTGGGALGFVEPMLDE